MCTAVKKYEVPALNYGSHRYVKSEQATDRLKLCGSVRILKYKEC